MPQKKRVFRSPGVGAVMFALLPTLWVFVPTLRPPGILVFRASDPPNPPILSPRILRNGCPEMRILKPWKKAQYTSVTLVARGQKSPDGPSLGTRRIVLELSSGPQGLIIFFRRRTVETSPFRCFRPVKNVTNLRRNAEKAQKCMILDPPPLDPLYMVRATRPRPEIDH